MTIVVDAVEHRSALRRRAPRAVLALRALAPVVALAQEDRQPARERHLPRARAEPARASFDALRARCPQLPTPVCEAGAGLVDEGSVEDDRAHFRSDCSYVGNGGEGIDDWHFHYDLARCRAAVDVRSVEQGAELSVRVRGDRVVLRSEDASVTVALADLLGAMRSTAPAP